jgi:hypothetical protein
MEAAYAALGAVIALLCVDIALNLIGIVQDGSDISELERELSDDKPEEPISRPHKKGKRK